MNVDFITAIKMFFANYANFNGRSTRAEYWWVMLFLFLVAMILGMLNLRILTWIFELAIIVPSLALLTRRFHDIGKSGWWVVGFAVLNAIFSGSIFAIVGSALFANDPTEIAGAMANNMGSIGIVSLLSVIVSIVMIVFCCKPSAPDNQYGPNPYGE